MTVRIINHRGYNTMAPENTLPAYRLSAEKGFRFVETDVSFTKDQVPVLLHDAAINRTARNQDGSKPEKKLLISEMTYEEALRYDFGIWKSEKYKGTKIPAFEEFLQLCRDLRLDPYIELKENGEYKREQTERLAGLVRRYGMAGSATWISFSRTYLEWVRDCDPESRLGLLQALWSGTDDTEQAIRDAKALQTGSNEVFLDVYYDSLNRVEGSAALCRNACIPVEIYFVGKDDPEALKRLIPYISGATTNEIRPESSFG